MNKEKHTNTALVGNEKLSFKKEALNVLWTLIASVLSAVGLYMFVYPSNFAPSGVDGIATMLQSITKVNAGIYSLLLNMPLLIIAWFLLKKRYVIYTVLFTVVTSVLLLVCEWIDLWQYQTETNKLISAIFSGVLHGARTGIMLKMGASSGGIDIVACMIQKKRPYGNVERLISIICYFIMGASFFVYNDLECIFLSIVQMFVFEKVSSTVLAETRKAIEIKITTKSPEAIKHEILHNLKHGATIVESKGMWTEEGNSVIFSVINRRQLPEFLKMIKKYPDTFVYYSNVQGVQGNFRWFKDDEAK